MNSYKQSSRMLRSLSATPRRVTPLTFRTGQSILLVRGDDSVGDWSFGSLLLLVICYYFQTTLFKWLFLYSFASI